MSKVKRYVATISVYIHSEEKNNEQSDLSAVNQLNNLCKRINSNSLTMGASIESISDVPWGNITETKNLDVSKLQNKINSIMKNGLT